MFKLKGTLSIAMTIGVLCLTSSAAVMTSSKGTWPGTWPKELEPFREQAKTREVAHGIQETVHEISFKSAEDFMKAWPHFLTLMESGSKLTIVPGPSTYSVSGSTLTAGVRIICPSNGEVRLPDRTRMKIGPPWSVSVGPSTNESPKTASGKSDVGPKLKLGGLESALADYPTNLRLPSVELPEYAVVQNGQWVPYTGQEQTFRYRARVDIVLVTDGKTVDINRIQVPDRTPIAVNPFRK